MKIFLLSQAQGKRPGGNKLFYLEICLGDLMAGLLLRRLGKEGVWVEGGDRDKGVQY